MKNEIVCLFILVIIIFLGCKKEAPLTCGQQTVLENKYHKGDAFAIINNQEVSMKSVFVDHWEEGFQLTHVIFSADTCSITNFMNLQLKNLEITDTIFLNEYEPSTASLSFNDDDVTYGVYRIDMDKENWILLTSVNNDDTEIKGNFHFSLYKTSGQEDLPDSYTFKEGVFISEYLK